VGERDGCRVARRKGSSGVEVPCSVMLGAGGALSVGQRLAPETCWEGKRVLLREGLALGACEPLNEASVESKGGKKWEE